MAAGVRDRCRCEQAQCFMSFDTACEAPITAEDLLCDYCRTAKTSGLTHCHKCQNEDLRERDARKEMTSHG